MLETARCPHCEWALFPDENKTTNDWCFAQCRHCHGFSMVRQIIKANKQVPKTSPVQLLAKDIVENKKPIIVASSRHLKKKAIVPPPPPKKRILSTHKAASPAQKIQSPPAFKIKLPEPLPDVPEKKSFFRKFFTLSVGALILITLTYSLNIFS